jgi:hypothetical protein
MRKAVLSPLLIASVLATAQSTSLPKYKVVRGNPPEKAVPEMNAAAHQGYRFLLGAQLAIMHLDTAPPDTYRYLPAPETGYRNDLLNQLNLQGALGYGLLKETKILEKEPHPRNYEYAFINGFTKKAQDQSKDALLAQGFQLVGFFGNEPLYMREIGKTEPAQKLAPLRMVRASSKRNLLKNISKLAGENYRYRSNADPGANSVYGVTMELCSAEDGAPFEYRAFEVGEAAQLEQQLNALGQEGFRIVAESLRQPPYLAERLANHAQKFAYRVIGATDASTTENFVNVGDRDGFVPIAFAAHVALTVHLHLILEKAVPASAP